MVMTSKLVELVIERYVGVTNTEYVCITISARLTWGKAC